MATNDKYTSPFMYTCTNGHWNEGPKALSGCMACPHGEPCTGTLTRVNAGGNRWTKVA